MMYSSPYFHAPFFPPVFRRYPPKYAFPQKKINSTIAFIEQKEEINTVRSSNSRPQKANTLNLNNSFSQEKNKIILTPTQEKSSNTLDSSNAYSLGKEKTQKNRSCEDKPIFEILGIQLYFDDLLILGLLFFLYSEGVQDQELFLALILLLFS